MATVKRSGLLALTLVGFVAACSSSTTHAAPTLRPAPIKSSAQPSPLVPPSPPQSAGFVGPDSFDLDWNAVTFTSTACSAGHPTANCYVGTGNAKLPVVGQVTLARTVIVGDAPGSPAPGCVTADTDGTVTSPTGRLTFQANGQLCGRSSAFTVYASTGTGSMAGYVLHAEIINDSTTESWFGQLYPL